MLTAVERYWKKIDVYNSFVCEKIDNFNSSFYYDNPQNILNAYLTGEIE